MSEELEDVVLEPVEPDTPPKETPAEVTPDEGIAALQAQLDAEKAAREAADHARRESDRIANEAMARAVSAQQESHETNIALVTQAIDTLKGQQDQLEANLAAAAAAGDWAEHAKFQRQMSDNSAKLSTLESGKEALESRKAEAPQIIQLDPVEALARTLSPASADWVRRHPEYATDPRKNAKMIAAHNYATINKELTPDTPAYFALVEQELGISGKAVPVQQKEESPLSEAADTPPSAAPVRKEPLNGRRVTLTQAEREIAEMSGQTPEEYAAAKVQLQKEGLIH